MRNTNHQLSICISWLLVKEIDEEEGYDVPLADGCDPYPPAYPGHGPEACGGAPHPWGGACCGFDTPGIAVAGGYPGAPGGGGIGGYPAGQGYAPGHW